jgi:hypothetical protein
MIISHFEAVLPWLSLANCLFLLWLATNGTRKQRFGVSGHLAFRRENPAAYWIWFALHWTCAVMLTIVTMALFGIDIRISS